MSKVKHAITFGGIVLVIIIAIFFLRLYSPADIVDSVGVHNSYVLVFVSSLFGGLSSITGVSFVALLATLGSELNILLLGTIAGIGLFIGDVLVFVAMKNGRELISGKVRQKIDVFAKNHGKTKFLPLWVFLYMGLTPFPNDILSAFLVTLNISLKKMWVPFLLGDVLFCTSIAFLGSLGFSLF